MVVQNWKRTKTEERDGQRLGDEDEETQLHSKIKGTNKTSPGGGGRCAPVGGQRRPSPNYNVIGRTLFTAGVMDEWVEDLRREREGGRAIEKWRSQVASRALATRLRVWSLSPLCLWGFKKGVEISGFQYLKFIFGDKSIIHYKESVIHYKESVIHYKESVIYYKESVF